ncbi:MAG: alcohol dehydrogenase catalytic domain-containing protein [Hyphomicrobiaceae bacterium]
MQAVRLYAKGDLRVEQVPRPGALQEGEVRIAVEHAGICGSDLHNFRTGQWITRSPSVAGHEFAGRVVEVGAGVTGFEPGQRVAADSRYWCGKCAACREGRHHLCERLGFVGELCDGGFAEQTVLPVRLVHRVPDGVPSRIAATAEPFAVAMHAVRRLDPQKGEPVLVVGCGPIGGFCAVVLAHLGFGPILVADRNAARAELVASTTGATVTALDPETIKARLGGKRLAAAIDATGSVAALGALIPCLPGGARLALVGISHGTLDLDPNVLVERELSLIGCHAFQHELAEAIAMLPACAPMIAPLLAPEITLGEVPAAYDRLIAGNSDQLKTLIRISP